MYPEFREYAFVSTIFSADVYIRRLYVYVSQTQYNFLFLYSSVQKSLSYISTSLIEYVIWEILLRVHKGDCESWMDLALRGRIPVIQRTVKEYCLAVFEIYYILA